jgi:tricorn protease
MNTVRLFLIVWITLPAFAESPKGYYRFPSLHGDTVVFTAEGDLWRVGVTGGVAQRLTTHPGQETDAAISPDGELVAFSAEYEGPTEVYIMPLAGGLPTRLTFDGGRAQVVGWAFDQRILYSTTRFSTLPNSQLVYVDTKSGARDVLPLAQANQGVVAPDTRRLFFTRLAKQSSSTKRYQGGTAENIWTFAKGDSEARPLTADYKGTSRDPMWWNGRVYFASDRDGVMNIWSMKPDGSDVQAHTKHRDQDVKSPSQEGGRIIYQHGPDLRLLELASGRDVLLDIRLTSDFDQQRERWIKKPLDYLTSYHLSPNGDRVVLTARGQVFVAPVSQGRFVDVSGHPEVRYRNARFMPDGKSLLAMSDASGELEFNLLPANGAGSSTVLTSNGVVFRFDGIPAPDGKRIAYGDKDRKLWIHDIDSHQATLVLETPRAQVDDYVWSPDSQWLAFTSPASNQVQQVLLYHVTDRTLTAVTSDRVESYGPQWSPDGQWLYFLSDRELRSLVSSPWGLRQPEPFFTETTKIYGLALQRDARWPFRPKDELDPPDDKKDEKNDEKKEDKEENKKEEKKSDEKPAAETARADGKSKVATKPTVVHLDGIAARLFEVPIPAGNYSGLKVTSKHLLWGARDLGFGAKTHLKQLEITRNEPKPKTLVEDVSRYELSADGKKLLVRKGEAFYVITADAASPAKLDDKLNLDGWTFSLTPRQEWRQILSESWRMMRDYFYDRGMHGVDWKGMLAKYRPHLDRVSDRAELNDVIADMVGELSALHIFVAMGDEREGPDRIRGASLGARCIRDDEAGGWRVEHIYRGDPDYPSELAPLAQPGVEVGRGDVITAINGRSTVGPTGPDLLLRNQAGKQVLLEVKPAAGGTNRLLVVKPISEQRDQDLRYDEWELTRRETVEKLGFGQVGYVHLRAMGPNDIAQWARNFFPVFNRQGLIIDVRHNSGGNIDSWILSKLLRKAWFYWQPRVGEPTWNMQYAFRGHVVVLCNERTASDGEAFTEGFRRLGLGKVIGTRTWGGEIWLSAQRWLVDSGMATAAEIGVYGPEGSWLIEGHGVEPDIAVDNLPHETFNGRDAQLEAGIKHLQELIAKEPRPVPPTPKYPDKSFKPVESIPGLKSGPGLNPSP